MNKSLYLKGKKYISASRAADVTGYASDYIGQLCRSKKITASLVGRSWYVLESEILDHKSKNLLTHKKTIKTRRLKRNGLVAKLRDWEKEKSDKRKEDKNKEKETIIFDADSALKNLSAPRRNEIKPNISSTRDVKGIKPLYLKDDKELFPILKKGFDVDAAKAIALRRIEESMRVPKRTSHIEKFVANATVISLVLLSISTFVFGEGSDAKLVPTHFIDKVNREISFLYDSHKNNFLYSNDQLASSIFSGGWDSISNWFKNTAYKIIKPWIENSVLVNNPPSPPYIKGEEGIARTVVIAGADKNYVDTRIEELKKYFLTLPLVSATAPNINRYYITNQNDRIISNVNSNIKDSIAKIDGSIITNSSFSGSASLTSLSVSGSAAFTGSTTVSDLISQNYLSVGTTTRQDTLTLDGALFLASLSSVPSDTSSRLYNTNNGDLYWAGNLIGGATTGNWATDGTNVWRSGGNVGIGTTTPNNKLDVMGSGYFSDNLFVGGAITGTSTLNISGLSTFIYSSSTIYSSFATASTTNLIVNNSSFNNLLGSGLLNTGGSLTLDRTGDWTGTLDGFEGFGFPFVAYPWGVSTSTTIGMANGFISNASSTISNSLYLSSLSVGGLNVGTNGLLYSSATTTFGSGYSTTTQNNLTFSTTTQTLNGITYGQTIVPSAGALIFTPSVSGSLSVAGGGTGQTTLSSGQLLYGNGVGAIGAVATGTISVPTGLTVTANRYAVGGAADITLTSGYVIPLQSTLNTYTNIVSTSTNETMGQLSYWTTTSGSPARLGSVATTTLSCSGGSSCSQGVIIGSSPITISSAAWPFTPTGTYVSTSTTLGLLNGFFSTASSTISGNFMLPSLSQGFAYTGSAGKLNTIASSSIQLSWFNNDSGFLTSATGLTSYDAWTHPSAGISATTSLMQLFGQASSTLLSANYAQFGGTGTTTITNAGYVGIGSSTPWGMLSINPDGILGPAFVIGSTTQCVTGDTKLRRRRRKKSKKKNNPLNPPYNKGETETEWEYDNPIILDIEEGDEIQSLDTKTGKLVWSKVKQVVYTGKKETWKLTTASGKSIRTTSEHPYFVKSEIRNPKSEIKKTFAFVDASNIYYGTKEAGWKIDFAKLKSYLTSRFGVSRIFYFGAINETEKSDVKLQKELISLGYELMLVTLKRFRNGKKKADTDSRMTFEMMKIKDEYNKAVVLTGDGDFFWVLDYLKEVKEKIWLLGMAGRTARELTKLFGSSFIHLGNVRKSVEKTGEKETDATFASVSGVPVSYQNTLLFVKDGVWTKVKEIKEGEYIAVADNSATSPLTPLLAKERGTATWDKIVKIEKMPAEDVYDIEIENTHNFVANGIIAHNTHFVVTNGGNVGIGTTSPYRTLSVSGSGVFTGGDVLASTFTATSSASIPALSNLTSNGFVYTTGENGMLNTAASSSIFGYTPLASYDAWTHPSAGISATTSALSFPYSSSTAYSSFITASTTNLNIGGSSFNSLLGTGLQKTGEALTLNATGDWTGTLDGFEGPTLYKGAVSTSTTPTLGQLAYWTGNGTPSTLGTVATTTVSAGTGVTFAGTPGYLVGGSNLTISTYAWPFIAQTNYVSTSTVLGLNGFFSTASSTISGAFNLPTLSQGFAYIGSDKTLLTAASSSLFGFTPYSDANPANYISLSALSGTFPIGYNSGTGAISFGGLSTSSSAVVGNIPYFSGVNTFANVATGTVTCSGLSSCDADSYVIGSSLTISSLYDAFTHPSAGISATTSLMQLFGSASSTLLSANQAWFGGTGTTTITNAGWLGIGTSSPWGLLSVNPNALGSGVPEFVVGSSTATHFIIDGAGNVGIGKTTPTSKLYVNGNVELMAGTTHINVGYYTVDPGGGYAKVRFGSNTANADFTTNLYYANAAWNSDDAASGSALLRLRPQGASGSLQLYTSPIGSPGSVSLIAQITNDPDSNSFINTNGNFGIGTTSPSSKLTVWGSDTGATNLANFVNSASTSVMTILNNGNVGIGTTGPGQKLSVNDSISSLTTGGVARLYNSYDVSTNGTVSYPVLTLVRGGWPAVSFEPTMQIGISRYSAGGSTAKTQVDFMLTNGNTNTPDVTVMSLLGSGNVGIGTTNPGQRLVVVGHCVTGDTLLPIRRRRKSKNSTNGNIDKGISISSFNQGEDESRVEWDYLMVRIDQVQTGDEVLSLNKNNGLVEYHPIRGLMDMGVQDVFELRTKSGRVIRTTATHPYLVKIPSIKSQIPNKKSASKKLTEIIKSVGNYLTNNIASPKTYGIREKFTPVTSEIGREMLPCRNFPSLNLGEGGGELGKEQALRDAHHCPYCSSKNFVKRGVRKNKYQTVQLYICRNEECGKTFTASDVRGKHFPLRMIIEGMSLYNLGLTLENVCKILNQKFGLNPGASTLSDWVSQYKQLCTFSRLREYAIKMFNPKNMIEVMTMAHRQLYRFRYHRAKIALMLEEFGNRNLKPLKEYLDNVSSETPHQYFQEGERMSEIRSKFDKADMIVRGKHNYANKLAAFVLQAVKDNKQRHEELQRFMIANDSCTVATEVPVYIRREDVAHMENILKFKISDENKIEIKGGKKIEMPKLLTGHVDLIQIRNGSVHLLDYKPNAEKEKPIEQLTWYAMALSRLTGLRLFEFKCGWFDEKDYFEFYPLHVVKKLQPSKKKRKIYYKSGEIAEVPRENELVMVRNRSPDYQDSG